MGNLFHMVLHRVQMFIRGGGALFRIVEGVTEDGGLGLKGGDGDAGGVGTGGGGSDRHTSEVETLDGGGGRCTHGGGDGGGSAWRSGVDAGTNGASGEGRGAGEGGGLRPKRARSGGGERNGGKGWTGRPGGAGGGETGSSSVCSSKGVKATNVARGTQSVHVIAPIHERKACRSSEGKRISLRVDKLLTQRLRLEETLIGTGSRVVDKLNTFTDCGELALASSMLIGGENIEIHRLVRQSAGLSIRRVVRTNATIGISSVCRARGERCVERRRVLRSKRITSSAGFVGRLGHGC
jgi:hypothetical protein